MNASATLENTSRVAELLAEREKIEQQQQELDNKNREIQAALHQARNSPENKQLLQELRKSAHSNLMRARYSTTNGLTIHKLRQAGHSVSVMHVRYTTMQGVKGKVPVPSYLRGAFEFHPRGGATHVTICKPNGEWMCLTSVCHVADSFDYKMGVKTALDQLTNEEASELLKEQEEVVIKG